MIYIISLPILLFITILSMNKISDKIRLSKEVKLLPKTNQIYLCLETFDIVIILNSIANERFTEIEMKFFNHSLAIRRETEKYLKETEHFPSDYPLNGYNRLYWVAQSEFIRCNSSIYFNRNYILLKDTNEKISNILDKYCFDQDTIKTLEKLGNCLDFYESGNIKQINWSEGLFV